MSINYDRLKTANEIIPFLLRSAKLEIDRGKVVLTWKEISGKRVKKTWQTRNGSFYPTFSIPTGGTHTIAIAQLINWAKDNPALPIQTWEYWCSETVGMKNKDVILPALQNSDYPKEFKCYFCGVKNKNLDWYSFGGKYSGLGCWIECDEIKAKRLTNK